MLLYMRKFSDGMSTKMWLNIRRRKTASLLWLWSYVNHFVEVVSLVSRVTLMLNA